MPEPTTMTLVGVAAAMIGLRAVRRTLLLRS
ncbi:PEP-CTERM sorting domain-containing protein [Luteitalea pratensis]